MGMCLYGKIVSNEIKVFMRHVEDMRCGRVGVDKYRLLCLVSNPCEIMIPLSSNITNTVLLYAYNFLLYTI